jgi:hypothetical protein
MKIKVKGFEEVAHIALSLAWKKLAQLHFDKYNRLFKVQGTEGVEHIKLDEKGRDSMGMPLFDFRTRCIIKVTPREN